MLRHPKYMTTNQILGGGTCAVGAGSNWDGLSTAFQMCDIFRCPYMGPHIWSPSKSVCCGQKLQLISRRAYWGGPSSQLHLISHREHSLPWKSVCCGQKLQLISRRAYWGGPSSQLHLISHREHSLPWKPYVYTPHIWKLNGHLSVALILSVSKCQISPVLVTTSGNHIAHLRAAPHYHYQGIKVTSSSDAQIYTYGHRIPFFKPTTSYTMCFFPPKQKMDHPNINPHQIFAQLFSNRKPNI